MNRLAQQAEYLSKMGVQPWYSRVILAGAAQSPHYHELVSVEANVVAELGPSHITVDESVSNEQIKLASEVERPQLGNTAEPNKVKSSRLDSSLLADMPEAPSVDGEKSVDHACVSSNKASDHVIFPPSCSLALLKHKHDVVLLGGYQSESAPEQLALASAVLSAIELKKTQLTLCESFVWPVFDGEISEAGDDDLMRTALSRFFEHERVALAERVICIGSELSRDAVIACAGLSNDIVWLSSSVTLGECLQNAQTKSKVWSDLSHALLGKDI